MNTGARLIDGDGKEGRLLQCLGKRDEAGCLLSEQPADGVQSCEVHGGEKALEVFAEMICDATPAVTVVDLPSRSYSFLLGLEREMGSIENWGSESWREDAYQLTIISMIIARRSSIFDVEKVLRWKPNAHHVIVKNIGLWGDYFGASDESDTKNRLNRRVRRLLTSQFSI